MGSVDNFDYIIVGGGTAGLTVADRLTEDENVSVLVVEAGEDRSKDPLVLTPGLVAGVYGNPDYDWNFNSVPQPGLNNRKINQPRGKQLGGSSALNFMMLVYPNRGSIDSWEALGNEGWGYDSLAPYFRKFATVHAPPQAAKDVVGLTYHNESLVGDGPVQVSFSEGYGPTNSAWMETFAKFGLEMTADMRTHYTPAIASRPNLTILTGTIAKKILFDTTGLEPVATGILAQSKDGPKKTLNAREVILSAGALMSPQILELSGVGSRSLLEKHGIPVVIENPNVGEHLQDHAITCQSFEVNPDIASSDMLRDPAVLNALLGIYQASRDGPMGQSNISVAYAPLTDASGILSAETKKALFAAHDQHTQTLDGQIIRSLLEKEDGPTAQYLLFPGQVNTYLAEPSSMMDYLAPSQPGNFITIMSLLNHPFSRGSVHINSRDVNQLPTWDPNFNSNPLDLEISALHAMFVEKFANTAPFSTLLKPDGARIPKGKADSVEAAKKIVRQTQVSDFHPCGSCTMRPKDKGGVVDTGSRVHGAKGLRVVDASIFPFVPLGNIQSVVYAVAEKAADLIKRDRLTEA
ncbi:Oxygen-dependent choline dehydrogenase [Talaromyces pinophilus]|nr:Oxygen-dependent choline dehydrogenase [Talaromyces pinophilus]